MCHGALKHARFSVLNHLVRVGDGPTPHAIQQGFQLPKTSMTSSLTVPKRAGLIDIRNNLQEGRSKLVFTMEAVQRFRQEAMNASCRMNRCGLSAGTGSADAPCS